MACGGVRWCARPARSAGIRRGPRWCGRCGRALPDRGSPSRCGTAPVPPDRGRSRAAGKESRCGREQHRAAARTSTREEFAQYAQSRAPGPSGSVHCAQAGADLPAGVRGPCRIDAVLTSYWRGGDSGPRPGRRICSSAVRFRIRRCGGRHTGHARPLSRRLPEPAPTCGGAACHGLIPDVFRPGPCGLRPHLPCCYNSDRLQWLPRRAQHIHPRRVCAPGGDRRYAPGRFRNRRLSFRSGSGTVRRHPGTAAPCFCPIVRNSRESRRS